MLGITMELLISSIILIITGTTFLWNWIDRRKKKPTVLSMLLNQQKNYFTVTMYNNASYNLRIKKAYVGRIWIFRKQMSIGTLNVNNKSHSDSLSKQKLGNIFNESYFKMYLELDEDVSEKTFIFKTNAGSCKFVTKKINK